MKRHQYGAIRLAKAPLVLVEWVDSGGHDGWHHIKDLNVTVFRCLTVGWVVAENDEQLTIGSTQSCDGTTEQDQVNSVLTIPKVAIVRRRRLPPGGKIP